MTIFVTKYALSQGILEMKAELSPDNPKLAVVKRNWATQVFFGEGREWHRDRGSAQAHAAKMVTTKIVSLKKQIAKLEAMVF